MLLVSSPESYIVAFPLWKRLLNPKQKLRVKYKDLQIGFNLA